MLLTGTHWTLWEQEILCGATMSMNAVKTTIPGLTNAVSCQVLRQNGLIMSCPVNVTMSYLWNTSLIFIACGANSSIIGGLKYKNTGPG